jgi:hypothetical protein
MEYGHNSPLTVNTPPPPQPPVESRLGANFFTSAAGQPYFRTPPPTPPQYVGTVHTDTPKYCRGNE